MSSSATRFSDLRRPTKAGAAPSTDGAAGPQAATPPRADGRVRSRAPTLGRQAWVSLVEFDSDLKPRAGGWSALGARRLVARVAHLPPGPFSPEALVDVPTKSLGLMVIEGLALVQVAAGRAPIGWLIGVEDLVRPWEMDEASLLKDASWVALSPLRVALLDGDFARRASGTDSVTEALLTKVAQTSHWLFAKSLVTGTSVIEERLLLLFALLGERWGKATAAGVFVGMPLTHQVLATLIGARRPSVSTALRELSVAGLLRRTAEGWLLCRTGASGEPPRPRCWPQYADALGFALS